MRRWAVSRRVYTGRAARARAAGRAARRDRAARAGAHERGRSDGALAAAGAARVDGLRRGGRRDRRGCGRQLPGIPTPMTSATILDRAADGLGGFLPRLAGALLLLIVGWLVVSLIRRMLVKVL